MVTIASLWLPILVSAILVWIVSALVWMVLPHHKSDFQGVTNEESARKELKKQDLAPGQYMIPYAKTDAEFKDPAMQKKYTEGPVAMITIMPNQVPSMGKNVGLSFVFYLVVGVLVAYLASRSLPADASYLEVFRLTGTVSWLAYGFGTIPDAIWFGRPWKFIWKNMADAFVYALLTAGTFGWLWA